MEMWFHDEHTDNVKLAIRVDYQVFRLRVRYRESMCLSRKSLAKFLL